jgi:hypothetical protein
VIRGAARQVAIAASVNQIVKLPRPRKLASYAAQFVTRWRCFGIWRRRSARFLNGKGGSWIVVGIGGRQLTSGRKRLAIHATKWPGVSNQSKIG